MREIVIDGKSNKVLDPSFFLLPMKPRKTLMRMADYC